MKYKKEKHQTSIQIAKGFPFLVTFETAKQSLELSPILSEKTKIFVADSLFILVKTFIFLTFPACF